MILFIVRHGEPIYGPDVLTEKGQQQARALVKRFTVHGLDRIYASPNGRAQETAQPTAEALGLPIATEPWMSENPAWDNFSMEMPDGKRVWSYSRHRTEELMDEQYASLTSEEVLKTPLFAKVPNPNYYYEIQQRSDDFLRRQGFVREGSYYISTTEKEERVAAFCHGGFGTIWLSQLTSVPLHRFGATFALDHTGVTVLHFEAVNGKKIYPEIISLNDLGHLRDSEAPYAASGRLDL